ncbi:uncharacterized protein [Ptychodera flava]|uniref:uncharacterized protein n=1 Tax=Ptychodera flava TaxID=63121 RepID=UPI003969FA87
MELVPDLVKLIPEEHYDALWKELQISPCDIDLYEDYNPRKKAENILLGWIDDDGGTSCALIGALDKIGLSDAAVKVKDVLNDHHTEAPQSILEAAASETASLLTVEDLYLTFRISDDDIEMYSGYKPLEKAKKSLLMWLDKYDDAGLDHLIANLEQHGHHSVAKDVANKVEGGNMLQVKIHLQPVSVWHFK